MEYLESDPDKAELFKQQITDKELAIVTIAMNKKGERLLLALSPHCPSDGCYWFFRFNDKYGSEPVQPWQLDKIQSTLKKFEDVAGITQRLRELLFSSEDPWL